MPTYSIISAFIAKGGVRLKTMHFSMIHQGWGSLTRTYPYLFKVVKCGQPPAHPLQTSLGDTSSLVVGRAPAKRLLMVFKRAIDQMLDRMMLTKVKRLQLSMAQPK